MKSVSFMETATRAAQIDRIGREVLITLVTSYRRWFSRLKTTRCAHGVVHGATCSEVALRALRERPLHRALVAIRSQFEACAMAHAATPDAKNIPDNIAGFSTKDNECCQAVIEVGIRKTLTFAYLCVFVIKCSLAYAYHSESMGMIGGFVFNWLGPNLIGAAASELWPISGIALACDVAVIVAIQRRKVPEFALALQLGLSLLVLYFEPWYMMAFGSFFWEFCTWGTCETLDQVLKRTVQGLGSLNLFDEAVITLFWIGATYTVWLGTFIAKDDA